MTKHIVQTTQWGSFKTMYGTPAVTVGDVQYTKHHIPFTQYFFGYCPKIDPKVIDFEKLHNSLEENECVNINFDVPNIIVDTENAVESVKLFESHGCVKSPRDQFAKSNILLDITPTEEQLLANMHTKCRYNINYAMRHGVTHKLAETTTDLDIFWELFESTSVRQKYYIRPKSYYKKLWEMLQPLGFAYILTSYLDEKPLASWMLFKYEDTLYYPYGGSSEQNKNLFGSEYVGWQAILLGKKLGCKTFDMWGAAEDLENTNDPWLGFTKFKLKFGGKYVKYIDSYDYVVNPGVYKVFSLANDFRWKVLKFLK